MLESFIYKVNYFLFMVKKKKKEKVEILEEKNIKKIEAFLVRERIYAENKDETKSLYDQSRFGEVDRDKVYYSLVEGLYLLEKGRMDVYDGRNKKLKSEKFDHIFLMITNILSLETNLLIVSKNLKKVAKVFKKEIINNVIFLPNTVSRKAQIQPIVLKLF